MKVNSLQFVEQKRKLSRAKYALFSRKKDEEYIVIICCGENSSLQVELPGNRHNRSPSVIVGIFRDSKNYRSVSSIYYYYSLSRKDF